MIRFLKTEFVQILSLGTTERRGLIQVIICNDSFEFVFKCKVHLAKHFCTAQKKVVGIDTKSTIFLK